MNVRIYRSSQWFPVTFLLVALELCAAAPEASAEDRLQPILWRQFIPGSGTTETLFIARSPQFILYRNGLLVYRDDSMDTPYQQVQLSKKELSVLLSRLEAEYHLSAVTSSRLEREEPYIKSVQKRRRDANTGHVVVWLGMHKPPTLHRYPADLLEARSGNTNLGPAWNALYLCSQYLSTFQHPRAKPLVPDRIEIAVQPLPSYLSASAHSAVAWPLNELALQAVQGTRKRGFRTVTGDAARRAYRVLSRHAVVTDNGETYLVWARPLLLPDRRY